MKLENACLCVEIAEKGAELTRIFNKKTGAEILWNGNPEFWNRHSPILFPNVGKTHGNTVLIKGTQYPTSQHGFARDSQFRCVKSAAEEAQFLFCSNEETREVYPYDFELYITYRLDGKNIFVDWKVKNPSEETIYFTIGAHPAFMFEGATETKDDYLLWFSKMETLECCGLNLECGTGLPEESYSLELEDGYLQLSEKLFEVDTLICDDYQLKEVWLCKKDGRKPYVKDFTVTESGHRRMRRSYVWSHGQAVVMIPDLIKIFLKRRESMRCSRERYLKKDTRFWWDSGAA